MAVLSTSYNVESSVKTTLKNTIAPTTTAGIQLNYALTITSGVLRFDPDTSREEFIAFGSAVVAAGITTLGDVVRSLTKTLNNFTTSGTGSQHSGGACIVELTNYHALYNLKANVDRSNTFTAAQTIGGTNKWFFNNANQWIYSDGNELFFRSNSQAEVALATLANLAGVNDKAKVSVNDTTEGYLSVKLSFADGLIASILNPAGNETLQVDVSLAANPGLEFSGGDLRVKVLANGGVVRNASGLSFDQAGNYTLTGSWDFSSATLTGVYAESLVTNILLGEAIAVNQSVAINGDEQAYLGQSDVLNDCFTFIGSAREGGAAADTKKINVTGPVVAISGQTPTEGRLWTGTSQGLSTSTAAVYDVNWEGQTFTPTAGQQRIDQIDLYLTLLGAPGGSYTVAIKATDGGGLPTGADLATASLATAAMATGLNRFTGFNLAVTPGTKYAIILKNAAATVANNYSWNYNNASVLANGNRVTSGDSGGTWAAQLTHDFRFTVYYNAVAGSDIYLNDTEGTFSLNPGTYFQRAGRAISNAKMVLGLGEPSIYATFTWAASAIDITVDTQISLGFRPKAVIAFCEISVWGSYGIWHHGLTSGKGFATGFVPNITPVVNFTGIGYGATAVDAADGEVTLSVQTNSADTITIRRVMNADGNDAPGGTIHLLLFG